jgi:hypothetical protein
MNQPNLFDFGGYDPKRVRRSDPQTSHQGADHIRPTAAVLRERMRLAFAAYPKTANEAAAQCVRAFGGNHESYRKRSGELKADGVVRVAFTRPCEQTGRQAEVLEVIR